MKALRGLFPMGSSWLDPRMQLGEGGGGGGDINLRCKLNY